MRKERNERRWRSKQRKEGDRIVRVKARGDILRQSVTQGREVERGCKLV